MSGVVSRVVSRVYNAVNGYRFCGSTSAYKHLRTQVENICSLTAE